MAGLIDTNTGLLFGTGLEFQTTLGGAGLQIVAGSGADRLLAGESNGLAIDFTDLSMVIKDTTTPANAFSGSPNSKMTYASPSTKWILGSNGLYASGTTLRTEYDTSGTALGTRFEESRTNVVLRNRDLSNASWTKSNVTAAKDQTGIDGVANSASSITATAGNGTCLQAITLASSARFQTAFVKRITGSGTLEMTMDNGTTWTTVTVTSSWTRVSIATQTLANPTVGFRIATNGDAFAIDFVQNENGTVATSPIEVSGTSVTRGFDQVYIASSAFCYSSAEYLMVAEVDLMAVSSTYRAAAFNANGSYGAGNGATLYISGATASAVAGNGTSITKTISPSLTANSMIKIGGTMKVSGTLQAATNRGQTVGSNSTCDWNGTSNRLQLASTSASGGTMLNGHIKNFTYIPRYDTAAIVTRTT